MFVSKFESKIRLLISEMRIINATPHSIQICNGQEIPASGYAVRLAMKYANEGEIDGIQVEKVSIGEVIVFQNGQQLTKEEARKVFEGNAVIVPLVVALQGAEILKRELGIKKVLVPATDKAKRDEKGRIVCVPSLLSF